MTNLRSSDGRVIVPDALRRRRVAVRRSEGRRRLHRLVAFGVLVAALAVGWALLRSPLMAVDVVAISGSTHVDASQVARATGIRRGRAMMDVSTGRAQRQLEALPWIASAKVTRQWPGRVRVTLRDRVPVAQVASGTTFASVDLDGRVLASGVKRDRALPLISDRQVTVAEGRVGRAGALLTTARALPGDLVTSVAHIGFDRDGAVALTLSQDGVVTLGRADGLPAKFASVVTVLGHVGELHKGCTLDVSVPMTPTLTPGYGCV